MKKNVLLIAPEWVNLHQDIIKGLESMGYNVEFIPENSFKGDPFRVKKRGRDMSPDKADATKTAYWKLHLGKTSTTFDHLLVIDGQGVNQYLFTELKRRNPKVFFVNYLYDTTYSYYHFEESFHFYDKVFSFDKKDAAQHQIGFLPIYWTDNSNNKKDGKTYEIFGFGAYSDNRYRLYRQIRTIAEDMKKSYFIKLYAPHVKHFLLYRIVDVLRPVFGRKRFIPYSIYSSDYITSELMTTDEFRYYVQSSDVVLDTKVHNQDGLTARFMWALGAGKKIITTNESVKEYDFYTPDQILILNDRELTEQDKIITREFIGKELSIPNKNREKLECYRLENWLKTVLVILKDEQ